MAPRNKRSSNEHTLPKRNRAEAPGAPIVWGEVRRSVQKAMEALAEEEPNLDGFLRALRVTAPLADQCPQAFIAALAEFLEDPRPTLSMNAASILLLLDAAAPGQVGEALRAASKSS